jgi:hypothetical protein
MRRMILTAPAIAAALAGCAGTPQQSLGTLDQADPAYGSQACLDARNVALTYNNKAGTSVGVGLASGILLGPFGLIPALAFDMNRGSDRKAFNAELDRRCRTPGFNGYVPGAPPPRSDQRRCYPVGDKIVCDPIASPSALSSPSPASPAPATPPA